MKKKKKKFKIYEAELNQNFPLVLTKLYYGLRNDKIAYITKDIIHKSS